MADIKSFPTPDLPVIGDSINIGGKMVKVYYTAADLANLTDEQEHFYLEPFIPTEGIVLMYGKFGTYKTPILWALAKAITTGDDLWGISPTKTLKPVLIVELDSPLAAIKTRIKKAIPQNLPIDTFNLRGSVDFINPTSVIDVQVISILSQLHQRHRYSVVFIDTLRCVHGLQDKDSDAPHAVYNALSRVFPGAVLFLVHHDRKTHADETEDMRDESFSGSQAWINHATVGIKVRHFDKTKNEILIQATKSQAAEITPAIKLKVIDGWDIKTAEDERQEAIERVLSALPLSATAKEQNRAIVEAFGVSVPTAVRWRLAATKIKAGKTGAYQEAKET